MENNNLEKPILADVKVGSKVRFNKEFKQLIVDLPVRDWLFYIKDDEFEVKEVKEDTISINGLHVLGFRPLSIFNIC